MCKSHFKIIDRFVMQHESDFFRLEGVFERQQKREKVVAKVIPSKRKDIERNDVVYQRLSDHVGLLPVVFIAPDDTLIVLEGSEERRRFLDNTLSQLDTTYLQTLIVYNKVLQQRNAALKKMATDRRYNADLIQTYNEQLTKSAPLLHRKRQAFIEKFVPIFQDFYNMISGEREVVNCMYQSKLTDHSFAALLQEATEKDRLLQRTTVGLHKDDLVFKINGFPLKRFGSQGQLKSFVLALKLAQYELLRQEKEVLPILLLDDIFDKLDEHRVQHLIQLLIERDFGQVFITDTHESRLEDMVKRFSEDYRMFKVENGKINH